jgi:hypothetical protein
LASSLCTYGSSDKASKLGHGDWSLWPVGFLRWADRCLTAAVTPLPPKAGSARQEHLSASANAPSATPYKAGPRIRACCVSPLIACTTTYQFENPAGWVGITCPAQADNFHQHAKRELMASRDGNNLRRRYGLYRRLICAAL